MGDVSLENKILGIISPIDEMWSNQVFRKLRVSKPRYTETRDKMIDQGWIHSELKNGRMYLKRIDFEAPKFENKDWARITRINCNTMLNHLKENKPLFKIRKKKKSLSKENKEALDDLFHELDRQMIVYTRLVNAEALGLIRSSRAIFHQKECVELVQEFIKRLLHDHKEFKEEIKEYAQSQLRTVQFKI